MGGTAVANDVADGGFTEYAQVTDGHHSQQLRTTTARHAGTGSPPCTVRRVGGGFAVVLVDEPQQLSTGSTLHGTHGSLAGTQEHLQVLPPEEAHHPIYSDADLSLIREILLLTEARVLDQFQRGAGSSEVTLAKLLKAYDKVLPLHGIQPQEDVFYYRVLLRLSLDPEPNWWTKFEALVRSNARRQAISTMSIGTAGATGRFTSSMGPALRTLSNLAAGAATAPMGMATVSAALAAPQWPEQPPSSTSRTQAARPATSKQLGSTAKAAKQHVARSTTPQRRQQAATAVLPAAAADASSSGSKLARRASAPGGPLKSGVRGSHTSAAAAAAPAMTASGVAKARSGSAGTVGSEKRRLRGSSSLKAPLPTAGAAAAGPAFLRSRSASSALPRSSTHPWVPPGNDDPATAAEAAEAVGRASKATVSMAAGARAGLAAAGGVSGHVTFSDDAAGRSSTAAATAAMAADDPASEWSVPREVSSHRGAAEQQEHELAGLHARSGSTSSWRASSPSATVTAALQHVALAAGLQPNAAAEEGGWGATPAVSGYQYHLQKQLQQRQQQAEQAAMLLGPPEASGSSSGVSQRSSEAGGGGGGAQGMEEQQQQLQQLYQEASMASLRGVDGLVHAPASALEHAMRISRAASSHLGVAAEPDLFQPGHHDHDALLLREPFEPSGPGASEDAGVGAAAVVNPVNLVNGSFDHQMQQGHLDGAHQGSRASVRSVSPSAMAASHAAHASANSAAAAAAADAEVQRHHAAASSKRSRPMSLSPSPERHLSAGRHQAVLQKPAAAGAKRSVSPSVVATANAQQQPQQQAQQWQQANHLLQLSQQQQQQESYGQGLHHTPGAQSSSSTRAANPMGRSYAAAAPMDRPAGQQQQQQQEAHEQGQQHTPGAAHSSSKRAASPMGRSYSAAAPLYRPAAQQQQQQLARPSSPTQRSASAVDVLLSGVSFQPAARSRPSSPFEAHSRRPSTPPAGMGLQPAPSSRAASPSAVRAASARPASPSSAHIGARASSPVSPYNAAAAAAGGSHSPLTGLLPYPQMPVAGSRASSPAGLVGSRPGSPWGVFDSRPGSPWGFCSTREPASPCRVAYMQDWELEQYRRFLKQSALHGLLQQHRLVFQTISNEQDRAIAAWRLAMCFWEVHLVRRCLRRWRRRAVRSAAAASTSRRRWLLLCCFRWWLSMARHYRASRTAALMQAASADAFQQLQQGMGAGSASRAASPAPWHPQQQLVVAGQHFGVNLTLQQQLQDLELQIAAATKSRITWRDRLAAAFYAWREVTGFRSVFTQQLCALREHHEKQLRLQVWLQWRAAFGKLSPHTPLLRALYKRRRLRVTALVLAVWRRWAPAKRISRRAGRDARMTIVTSSKRRLLLAWHAYAAGRRVKRAARRTAELHHRAVQLRRCLAVWKLLPPAAAQLRDVAEQRAAIALAKQGVRLLQWWRTWTKLHTRKVHMMGVVVAHMDRGLQKRCLRAWKGAIARRKQLDRQFLRLQQITAANTVSTAFHGWLDVLHTRQRHRQLLWQAQQQSAVVRKHRVLAVLRWYVQTRHREVEVCEQIMRYDLHQVWRATWQRWAASYAGRQRLYACQQQIAVGCLRRLLRHWKALVDRKADWRSFSSEVLTSIIVRRGRRILQRWRAMAARKALLRQLLAGYTESSRLQRLALCWARWRQHMQQVAGKRLKALAALTQWEQQLLGKAWRTWRAYNQRRKYKQLQQLRAASYQAVRLMDTALMSWVTYWAAARDLAQKAELFRAAREVELQLAVVQAWREVAAEEVTERWALDRAVAHRSYHLLLVAFFNWRSVTDRRQVMKQQLRHALQRWRLATLAKAFVAWREWAGQRGQQRRKAATFLDVAMGRNVAWSFAMLRANAVRKRATALARLHHQQRTAEHVLRSWRARAESVRAFRSFLLGREDQLQRLLLRDTFRAWREQAARDAHLRETVNRALVHRYRTTKRAVFQAWLACVRAAQHKHALLGRAVAHWERGTLAAAFHTWRECARLGQAERRTAAAVSGRTLSSVFDAWRLLAARRAYCQQVEDHLSSKRNLQLLRSCWQQWRGYTAQSALEQQLLLVAASHLQRSLQAKAFGGWRRGVLEGRNRQSRLQYVLSHWANRSLAAAMYAWKQYVGERKQKRDVLEAALLHWQAGTLARAFAGWKEATQQRHVQRDVLAIVIGHWQSRALSRAFRAWREGVALRQAKRELLEVVVESWQQGLLRKAFDSWRGVSTQEHQERQQLRGVVDHWQVSTLRKAFFGWQAAAAARKEKRALLQRVVVRWQQGVTARAFAGWRGFVQREQRRRVVLQVVGGKVANSSLLRAFNSWREAAWLRCLKRQVVARWRHTVLHRAFAGWRSALLHHQQLANAQELACSKWANSSLWRAFNAWKDYWLMRRHLRAAATAVVARWQHQALSKALHALREHAVYRRMLKGVVVQWQKGLQAKAFHHWRAYTKYSSLLQQVEDTVSGRTRRRLAAAALQAWQLAAWEGPRERAAAKRYRLNRLKGCFAGWRSLAAHSSDRRELHSLATAKWRNLKLSAAWSAWREWVAERQYQRELLVVAAGHWRNGRLAAAFRTWREHTLGRRYYKSIAHSATARWMNVTLSAAFASWKAYAQKKQQLRAAEAAVVSRWHYQYLSTAFTSWRNTTLAARQRQEAAASSFTRHSNAALAMAFYHWRQAVVRRKRLAAAAEVALRRWRHKQLSAAFRSWQDTASRLAQLRTTAMRVAARWRHVRLAACFDTWRLVTQRGLAKAAGRQAAARHWRRRKLRRAWAAWRAQIRAQAKRMQVYQVLSGNTRQQLLRKALSSWLLHHTSSQKKAAAEQYATQRALARSWRAWRSVREAAAAKQAHAARLGAAAVRRRNQALARAVFEQWWRLVVLNRSAEVMALTSAQRTQLQLLRAWQQTASQLVNAKRLLRRRLLSMLALAFFEWRAQAAEAAHWKQVQQQLVEVLSLEHPQVRLTCSSALTRWYHWPLSAAFSSWREAVEIQKQERDSRVRALKFRYYTSAMKVLTGFKLAVLLGRLQRQAAAKGRSSILQRHFDKWWQGMRAYQVEEAKIGRALGAWRHQLVRRAFTTWRSWARQRTAKKAAISKAVGYSRKSTLREALRAWRRMVAYLKPMRAAMQLLQGKVASKTLRQVLAAWRRRAHCSRLLRGAVARMQQRTLANAFNFLRWRVARTKQLAKKFVATVRKLCALVLLRALNRWREYTQQRLDLKARALAVVLRLSHLRAAAAWASWRDYVAWRHHWRAQLALALAHRRESQLRAGWRGLLANVQEAHHHQQLSQDMLEQRQRHCQQQVLGAWRALAPVLHHRRTVLAYFRAKHLRAEGADAFTAWWAWAAERGRCRRATVSYWNRLMVKALGSWLMEAQASAMLRGAQLQVLLSRRKVLRAWRARVAARQRKRQLLQDGPALRRRALLRSMVQKWVEATYLAHMSHVALHFRVRRLGCLVLQQWQQEASQRAHLKQQAAQLTHQLACHQATQLLDSWRSAVLAVRHRRGVVARQVVAHWREWAAAHRTRSAGWRAARAVLASSCRMRVFYTWRWYTQERIAKAVAFRARASAQREALALGEQVARRRRAALVAAAFTAWRLQVSKYARVARKLAALMEASARGCFRAWRDVVQDARAVRLKAERLGRHSTQRRCLLTWTSAAAELAAESARNHDRAGRHWKRAVRRRVVTGWEEQTALSWERRQALCRVMVLVGWAEDQALLQEALQGWRAAAAARAALRASLITFVNKRRLGCLGDYLTTWHQWTVAMRPLGQGAGSSSSSQLGVGSALRPGSPVLDGRRSPARDRRLMRRLVAMAGGLEVDPGSQDDAEVFDNLPPTAAVNSALARAQHQQPLLQLSRGYRQRRVTLDGRPQWELEGGGEGGAAAAAAAGWGPEGGDGGGMVGRAGSPEWRAAWDMHSVAESMRQLQEGVPPWELPSVRSSPRPPADPSFPEALSLDQLRHYQHHYQYTVRPGSPPADRQTSPVDRPRSRSANPSGHSLRGLPYGQGQPAAAAAPPEGYYYDAEGQLHQVRRWYNGRLQTQQGGSPQQRSWRTQQLAGADVWWQQRRTRSASPAYGQRRRSSSRGEGDLVVETGSYAGGRDDWYHGSGGQPTTKHSRQYGSTGDLQYSSTRDLDGSGAGAPLRDAPLMVVGGGNQRSTGGGAGLIDGRSVADATSTLRASSSRLPLQPPISRVQARWRNAHKSSSLAAGAAAASGSRWRQHGSPAVLQHPGQQQQEEEEGEEQQRPVLFSVGVWQYVGGR